MKLYFIYQTPRKLVHITSASQAESNGSWKPIRHADYDIAFPHVVNFFPGHPIDLSFL